MIANIIFAVFVTNKIGLLLAVIAINNRDSFYSKKVGLLLALTAYNNLGSSYHKKKSGVLLAMTANNNLRSFHDNKWVIVNRKPLTKILVLFMTK